MPTYKLTYFNFAGLGEPIRWMLSYLDVPFEDNRIEREQWPTIKSTTPYGQVPVLEVDGKQVCQSTAIARYLGKKAGLAGSNEWEDLMIDTMIDTFNDFRSSISKWFRESDEATKKKLEETLLNETVPFYFNKFNDHIKNNGGYLANGKLSWGDIYFISILEFMTTIWSDIIDKYEHIKALNDKVVNLPKIKAWIEKRPVPKK
uniref:glutathione transferase n=2 Tax=Nilaparvata lugens TaxID=108931 RepID=J9Q529_NILLU|nr:glutathione s-transferase S2 [Nilaparvata lugens]5H5L_A Chain A, Glutathione s-transferase S2 [Nilaparvata lugens]5H5L_B Chain B, Glutathione s-transferase S2 [Nilaparvata lugens]BAS01274.2 prostaglandin D synthase [Nilaparvata lugens]